MQDPRHTRNIEDDVNELHRRHREDGFNLTELGRQTGYAPATIRRAFRRHGLPIRPAGAGPRIPYAPLEEYMGAEDKAAGELLKRNEGTIDYWRAHGVPAAEADHIAVHLGTTPWNIWGIAWQHAMDQFVNITEAA
jgi:lambda repressor-like predicted transcriptional regulator